MQTRTAGIRWATRLLAPGAGCRSMCEARILAPAVASGPDAERRHDELGLSIDAPHRYAGVVDPCICTGVARPA